LFSGPAIVAKLDELTNYHRSVTAHSWGFEELRQKVFTLNAANLASLLGPAPSSKDMLDVRYDNVQEVLRHIARQESSVIQDIRPVPPDKLKFNRSSAHVQNLLTWGRQKADLVGQFFNDHPNPTYGDEIASVFKNEYENYRRLGVEPDIIFCKLQEFTGGSERGTPVDEAAVLAVLAYLFEQCDIFERPPEEATL
jgi:ABC-3C protein